MRTAIVIALVFAILSSCSHLLFPSRSCTNTVTVTNIVNLTPRVQRTWKFNAGDPLFFDGVSNSQTPGVTCVAINPSQAYEEADVPGTTIPGVAVMLGNQQPYKTTPRWTDHLDLGPKLVQNDGVNKLYRVLEYAYYRVDHVRIAQVRYFVSND